MSNSHGEWLDRIRGRQGGRMTKAEAFESIIRTIGVMDYGKERWFASNGGWYDRYDGRWIDNDELESRVQKALHDLGVELF